MLIYKKHQPKKEELILKKIFFDVDDVLCPTTLIWLKSFNADFGCSVSYGKMTDRTFKLPGFLPETPLRHLLNFLEDKAETLPHQAPDLIKSLAKEHQLAIITDRELSYRQSTDSWLAAGYAGCFSRQFFTKEIGRIKAKISSEEQADLVVEDHPRNILAIAAAGVQVLIMDQPWNRDIPEGKKIARIKTLAEVANFI